MADLRMAMKVAYVKYGLIAMAAMAPIMVVAIGPGLILLDPNAMDYMDIIMSQVGPMLALFFVIPAAMISANSFVGEREQNTLEPLLCTPLTDSELLVGKSLSALIPATILMYGGTAIAMIASNIILVMFGYPLMLIPDPPSLFLVPILSIRQPID